MTEPRLVTIEELEMMSPEERRRLHDERVITDLSTVDPAFLERVKADARRARERHEVTQSKPR